LPTVTSAKRPASSNASALGTASVPTILAERLCRVGTLLNSPAFLLPAIGF
jgi:hypothetical protein